MEPNVPDRRDDYISELEAERARLNAHVAYLRRVHAEIVSLLVSAVNALKATAP